MSILRRRITVVLAVLAMVELTSCETTLLHQFTEPQGGWRVRSGQLRYASPTATLIGEVVVRFSKSGDFELTFSKGPGVALIVVRRDATFARVEGPLARGSWSGRIDQAPPQLRSWIGLRDKVIATKRSLRCVAGTETFLFRF
jgi:hypothetical protein